jgi:hypothetical protein
MKLPLPYTPGPWAVRLQPQEAPHIVAEWADGEDVICKLETLSDDGLPELGNACILAAAPDLLAALEEALRVEQSHGQDWQPWAEAAREAIRKARGQL